MLETFGAMSLIRRPHIQAALVLVGLLTVFFWSPITRLRDGVYAPVDFTRYSPLTDVEPGYHVRNPLLSDVTQQSNTWYLYDRDLLRAGQIPLWNPYNGNGVPQLANYQSAVFSIYSLPFYLLPFKWAVLLSVAVRLWVIGFFTYLFFKLLGLKQLPALWGGVAFMFSGYNIVWLSYAVAATVTFIPLSLCCIEWLFQRYERRRQSTVSGSLWWPWIGLNASLVVGLLAGHPETLYFGGLLLGGYVLFRLTVLWRTGHFRVPIRLAVLLGAAVVLAVGIAAVQLLPFVEYLAYRYQAPGVEPSTWFVPPQRWPLFLFPDLLGNPSHVLGFDLLPKAYQINYSEVNGAYVGGVTLYLAVSGLSFAFRNPRRKFVAFFGLAALIFATYEYNLLGLKPLFNVLPMIKEALFSRSFSGLTFGLVACAAFGLDYLLAVEIAPAHRWKWAMTTMVPGILLLAAGAYGVSVVVHNDVAPAARTSGLTAAALSAGFDEIAAHIGTMTVLSGLALATVGMLALSLTRSRRQILAGALVGLTFLSTGFLLRDYNPTVDERFLYPTPPRMARFLEYARGKSLLVLGDTLLAPDVNMVYRVSTIGSYDALGVNHYCRLASVLFDARPAAFTPHKIDGLGMKLFGIDAVATDDARLFAPLSQSRAYRLAVADDNYAVFQYEGRLPAYHTVADAVWAATDDEALARLLQPGFDPARTVILNADGAPSTPPAALSGVSGDAPPTAVQVVSESATRIRLTVAGGTQPCYLVLAKTFYPGWKATVNGVDQPVYRANYAFSSIPLPPGAGTVEFYYDPDSFKIGAAISLTGLIALAVIVICGLARPAPSRQQRRAHVRCEAAPTPGA